MSSPKFLLARIGAALPAAAIGGLVALLAGTGAPDTAQAQAPAAPIAGPNSTARITPNFRDQDLGQLAEAVSVATGKTFIVDPRVRAQVNLISSTPMSAEEFYQAFLSVLQVHGFAALNSGNLTKIIPAADARTSPGNDLPTGPNGPDEMVTQVVTVKNTGAAQLVQVLRPLVATTAGHLVSLPGSNTLIISDRSSNVDRIIRIIRRIDQQGDANIEVIALQNSTAADVVRTLTALNAGQPAADAALAPKVVADDRSNSVLISGEASQRLRIAALIAHLDTPVENGGDTQVFYMRFADAEKLAPKLKEQMTGVAQAAAAPGGGGGAAAAAADKSTTIWADAETNALVITAPPKAMRAIKSVIDKLDIRRPQVLVEAIIVDVTTNKSADLGVNWAILSRDGSNVPVGGFVSPIGSANQAPASIVDLAKVAANPLANAAGIPNGTTFAVGRIAESGVNFAAVLRALRADSNSNVIATPTGTTMDNQEMELKVAQEVPFITGQYTTNTTGGSNGQPTPFTTIQREEVGTILKITPQISSMENNLVMLKIELESSELSPTVGDAGSRITNKRTINTTVLIEDAGVIVLGGLIRDGSQRGESRVPFLGRIPLIGEAFRVRNASREKSNLMVFIRPKILRDGNQTFIETNSKYNAIREEQRMQSPRNELIPMLPGDKPPRLPAPPVTPPPDPGTADVKTDSDDETPPAKATPPAAAPRPAGRTP